MTTPDDPMLSRIKKLLAKAEANGCTDEERDALNEKATELMLKYQIDSAMLAQDDRPQERIVKEFLHFMYLPKTYTFEYATMCGWILPAISCRSFSMNFDGRTSIIIVGFESDVAYAKTLCMSLITQCMQSLSGWVNRFETKKDMFGLSPQDKMKAKKAFVIGFGGSVSDKLKKIRQTVVEETTGAELVLFDRSKLVDDYMNDMKLRKAKSRNYDLIGQMAGWQAGIEADVGQTRVSDGTASRAEIRG